MLLKVVRVLALVGIALYLVPTGTHLFELENKLAMSPVDYMTVQRVYQGWALFGIVVFAAMALTLLHAILRRRVRATFILSLSAFLSLLMTQAIFWMFTYPMNVASNNWTATPEHFEAARRQWEYSHAASAVLTFLALLAMTAALTVDTDAGPASTPQRRSSAPLG